MEVVEIRQEHRDLVSKYAIKQTIGGFTNLSSSDIKKATREHFQYTGLYGEAAWHTFRYGNLNKLRDLLDMKYEVCRENGIGDGGYDDHITKNGHTRIIDIKSSHREANDVHRLNLIVPKREYHENTIYVAAFTIGKDRINVDSVILAGWVNNERVIKPWRQDEPDKKCVPVSELRDINILKKIF